MTPRRDGWLALSIFALLYSIYWLTFSGTYHASDEMAMLVTTDSLARRGEWDINLLLWMGEQQGSFGPDGNLYSRKGIGTTLAALPFYCLAMQSGRLGNVQTAMLTNAVVTALTGALVYLTIRRLRYNQSAAVGTALAFGLGTMAWPYARYLFSESLAGLGLTLAVYALATARQGGSGDPAPETRPGDGWFLLAGAGLAVALLARLNNAIAAPFLGLALLAVLRRHRGRRLRDWVGSIVLFGFPLLLALGITAWYNWLRFGNPLTTGYLPQERFSTPFVEGLYGLTLSPGKGLVWYNPLFFAALASWPAFFRRHRVEALLVGAVVLSSVAFYAPWYLWWAGHGWGPRFLVTILPLAILPLAAALQAASRAGTAATRRRALVTALAGLTLLSVAVQLLGVAVDFNLYLEDVHAELGLYHPDTLFRPEASPLLRQAEYISLENLDVAWARGDSIDWPALVGGLGLLAGSVLGLWAAWHRRLRTPGALAWMLFLTVGTAAPLLRWAPFGDVAEASRGLAEMERPGELAVLTDPLLTEPFQDAYDGRLPLYSVPFRASPAGDLDAVWVIGEGDPDPAEARFRMGAVQLDLHLPAGQRFGDTRLPIPLLGEAIRLGDTAELLAVHLNDTEVERGGMLSLTLAWRAQAPMRTSYTVFVHLEDQQGVRAGQVDQIPCQGGCPTTTWRPGDLVMERYELSVTAAVPPVPHKLVVGLYDWQTGDRLPVLDTAGNPIDTRVEVATVQVR